MDNQLSNSIKTPSEIDMSETETTIDTSFDIPDTSFGQLHEDKMSDTDMIQAVENYVPEQEAPRPRTQIIPYVTNPFRRDPSNDPRSELPPLPITDDMIEIIPFETRNVRPPDPEN